MLDLLGTRMGLGWFGVSRFDPTWRAQCATPKILITSQTYSRYILLFCVISAHQAQTSQAQTGEKVSPPMLNSGPKPMSQPCTQSPDRKLKHKPSMRRRRPACALVSHVQLGTLAYRVAVGWLCDSMALCVQFLLTALCPQPLGL